MSQAQTSTSSTAGSPPRHGFISYARENRAMVERLKTHLAATEHEFNIDFWLDSQILPGWKWEESILDNIKRANIVLLAVSPDFHASEYIVRKELPAIKQRKSDDPRTMVVPIWLCHSSRTVLCRTTNWLPMLNGELKPIDEWDNRNRGFSEVREGVDRLIEHHLGPGMSIFEA